MKVVPLLTAALAALTFSACGGTKNAGVGDESLAVIDVENALKSQTDLKLSQLGSKIEIVPLETTDSGLVNRVYHIAAVDDYLIVSSPRGCLSFGLNDGKFRGKIGRVGQGPEEYKYGVAMVDAATGNVLFDRGDNQFVNYTPDGKYKRTIKLPFRKYRLRSFVMTDSTLTAHVMGELHDPGASYLITSDFDGNVLDSISIREPGEPIDTGGETRFISGGGAFGSLYTVGSDEMFTTSDVTTIWNNNGRTRLHEALSDTIYNLEGHDITPVYAFNLGEKRYPLETRKSRVPQDGELAVIDIVENGDKIMFIVTEGNPCADNGKRYLGIYDKTSATTSMQPFVRVAPVSNKFPKYSSLVNDIDGFMPLLPYNTLSDGSFITLERVDKIEAWLEENPDFKLEGRLEQLAGIDPEANPVLMIVRP